MICTAKNNAIIDHFLFWHSRSAITFFTGLLIPNVATSGLTMTHHVTLYILLQLLLLSLNSSSFIIHLFYSSQRNQPRLQNGNLSTLMCFDSNYWGFCTVVILFLNMESCETPLRGPAVGEELLTQRFVYVWEILWTVFLSTHVTTF